MVLKDKSELIEVWDWIKAAAADNLDTPTVLLLVAQSVDSLAACAILTRLLEDEQLSHKVVPCADYADLSRIYTEQVADATELRSIVLINCGGIIDLMGHLQTALDEADDGIGIRRAAELPHPDCRWYVFDSHRPFALENMVEQRDDEAHVYVLHDGGDGIAQAEELVSQIEIMYDGDGSDEESEDEYDEPASQRRRVTIGEYDAMSPDSKRDRRRALNRLARRYYSASWHGTAASVLTYGLVRDLNRTSNEFLWMAIVGLTEQLHNERIEFETYVKEAQSLQGDVAALNQDGADEPVTLKENGDGGNLSVQVRQHVESKMRIDSVQELRLTLMRHWTVYEALTHSPYIASRLGLYQEAGKEKLAVWLARMGLPLEECKQEYAYMRKEFKDPLFDKMLQYGSEFGLNNLTYPSFRCVTQYGITQLAAADLVTSVTAVLENFDAVASPEPGGGAITVEGSGSGAFSSGCAALRGTGLRDSAMRHGIERAKELLKATVQLGHSILMQKEYANFADFYTITLKPGGDTPRFLHPLALTKLALFVADALREGITRLRDNPKPVLMAAPNPDASPPDFLVVAVLGSARCWRAGGKNCFGNAFVRAATATNAHIAHDGFDSAVCRVSAADLERFKEAVVLELDRAR